MIGLLFSHLNFKAYPFAKLPKFKFETQAQAHAFHKIMFPLKKNLKLWLTVDFQCRI